MANKWEIPRLHVCTRPESIPIPRPGPTEKCESRSRTKRTISYPHEHVPHKKRLNKKKPTERPHLTRGKLCTRYSFPHQNPPQAKLGHASCFLEGVGSRRYASHTNRTQSEAPRFCAGFGIIPRSRDECEIPCPLKRVAHKLYPAAAPRKIVTPVPAQARSAGATSHTNTGSTV